MLKVGIRAARTALHAFEKTVDQAAEAVGLTEQVDSLEESLGSLPYVEDLTRIVKVAADQWAPEKLPLYKPESGSHRVGIHEQKMTDPTRGRQIPMKVYYPKQVEDSPVVVLSHGLAANSLTYRYLGKHLASHGYTVVQPGHEGSDTLAVMKKTPVGTFTQEELLHRTQDLSFALDQLESDGAFPEELKEQTDLSRVAVAGHSFGALTAQAMAGVEVKDEDGQALPTADDRVDAFVAMSPFGDSFPTHLLGMDVTSYKRVEKPILYMSGKKDSIFTLGKGPMAHSSPYPATASEHKYNLVIDGGHHADFAQVLGLEDKTVADLTKSTTLAFLDAHLKRESNAESYLKNEFQDVARTWDSWAQSRDSSESNVNAG